MPRSSRSSRTSFQFTHPVRGATDDPKLTEAEWIVSIHAPREGCDLRQTFTSLSEEMFQFTHPVRGATTTRGAA